MKMPGFTAEVSLGRISGQYRTTRNSRRSVQAVIPQQHEHKPIKLRLGHPLPPHARVTCSEDGSGCVVAWYTSDGHLITVIAYWF